MHAPDLKIKEIESDFYGNSSFYPTILGFFITLAIKISLDYDRYMNNTFSENNQLKNLLLLVIVGGLLYIVGQYIASEPARSQKELEANREITVSGTGEVKAVPDIAKLTLSVQTGTQPTAEVAMEKLRTTFTNVLNAVKEQGIEAKDIQTTNLAMNPIIDYQDGRQTTRGFEASETIYITIRDSAKISDVLGKATSQGVNQVGGISFGIDDPDQLQQEAQDAAIADAKEHAEVLAKSLGVTLGKVKNFSANDNPGQPIPFLAKAEVANDRNQSGGGGAPVEAGEQTVTSYVTITYEIR